MNLEKKYYAAALYKKEVKEKDFKNMIQTVLESNFKFRG